MAKIKLEATAEYPVPGYVTMDQVSKLIAEAHEMDAPPNAEIGFDALMEFRSPVRARRVTVAWER